MEYDDIDLREHELGELFETQGGETIMYLREVENFPYFRFLFSDGRQRDKRGRLALRGSGIVDDNDRHGIKERIFRHNKPLEIEL